MTDFVTDWSRYPFFVSDLPDDLRKIWYQENFREFLQIFVDSCAGVFGKSAAGVWGFGLKSSSEFEVKVYW